MFINTLTFTASDLEAKEDTFREIMANTPEAEKLMAELDVFFADKNFDEIQTVYWTYWRWYVDVTWEFLNGLTPEKVAGVVGLEAPMALLCGRDVWKQIINYLAFGGYTELEMPVRYTDIRDSFLNSEMKIGKWDTGELTVKQLVAEVKKIGGPRTTSIEKAEFNAKLKGALMPKSGDPVAAYITVNADKVIDRLIGLVNFFVGVEPKDAWSIVDMAVHPEFYENIQKAQEAAQNAPPTSVATSADPMVSTSVQLTPQISAVNFTDIKSMMENKFTKGADGQFQDPTVVITMLNDLASRYKDERISELYVFNEKTNSFEWNNTLLTS